MTFAEEIKKIVVEDIIDIAISKDRGGNYQGPTRLMSWSEAYKELDYEYDAGYGSQDCHDIYVWTATKIYFIHKYDGSTSIISVPRNPEDL